MDGPGEQSFDLAICMSGMTHDIWAEETLSMPRNNWNQVSVPSIQQ